MQHSRDTIAIQMYCTNHILWVFFPQVIHVLWNCQLD